MSTRSWAFMRKLVGDGPRSGPGNRRTSDGTCNDPLACRGRRLRSPALWALACLFLAPMLAAGAAEETPPATGRWSKERAWTWYKARPWLFGVNYGPTTGSPLLPPWQDAPFDKTTADRELGWAEGIGVNSIRTFISYVAWEHDPERFVKNFEAFLSVAEKRGISVMPVLFGDCAVSAVIFTPNGDRTRRTPDEITMREVCQNPARWPRLRAYVQQLACRRRASR